MSVMPIMSTNRVQSVNQIKSSTSFTGEKPAKKKEAEKLNNTAKLLILAGIVTLCIVGYKKDWGKAIKKFFNDAGTDLNTKDGAPKSPPNGIKILLPENPKPKIISKNEGEYVDFEEIK